MGLFDTFEPSSPIRCIECARGRSSATGRESTARTHFPCGNTAMRPPWTNWWMKTVKLRLQLENPGGYQMMKNSTSTTESAVHADFSSLFILLSNLRAKSGRDFVWESLS